MSDGLDVDLQVLASDIASARDLADGNVASAVTTAREINDLEDRVRKISERLQATPPPLELTEPAPPPTWDALAGLVDEGRSLIDPKEEQAIEERFVDGFRMRTSLDRYDVMAGIAAGIVGAGVDWLVVKVPSTVKADAGQLSASELTGRIRGWATSSDNRLADLAKVPFDAVHVEGVMGMAPMTHRVQTFGHDPLLGLVLGTMDIMRGTMTVADPAGQVKVLATQFAPIQNPAVALGREVAHLLSDVVTTAGLPLPGWCALMAVPGVGQTEMAEVARWMYYRGYDTWHFLTMATSVAAVEAACRGYFGIRCSHDPDYRERVEQEESSSGIERVSDHPRYQAISLIGHAVATGGNVAKVLAAQGNPLAINYAQWLKFASTVTGAVRTQTRSPDLAKRSVANRLVLDTGWARLELDLNRVGDLDERR